MSFLSRWTVHERYRYAPRRRPVVVWGVSGVAFLAVLSLGALPSAYVIDAPGPVFNTIGTTTVTNDPSASPSPSASASTAASASTSTSAVPVIQVSGATTYPTSGSLNLLTVSQIGSPTSLPSQWQVLGAWLTSSSRVIPLDQVYPPGTTTESEASVNAASMASSQQSAIAAALTQLGYTVPQALEVSAISEGSHAQGVLQAGDVITKVNGKAVTTVDEILALAKKASDSNPLRVTFTRNGTSHTESIAPVVGSDGVARIGISVSDTYTFPISVTINLSNVGGPSAGMMFALGIIDTLTPGELTGGRSISGTGTITADGTVGAIGGIQQKLVAAANAGSTLFLAPSDNCDEVVGHVPSGLSVVKVSTLTEALAAVTQYGTTGSVDGLATCTS